jgi:hypothetical protein
MRQLPSSPSSVGGVQSIGLKCSLAMVQAGPAVILKMPGPLKPIDCTQCNLLLIKPFFEVSDPAEVITLETAKLPYVIGALTR